MVKTYIPNQGDIVSLNFNPQTGKEQAGRRPAVVISPLKYNKIVGLMICAPITSKNKGYPFEVELPQALKTRGVVLADHIRNVDYKMRKARFREKVTKSVLKEILEKLNILINIDYLEY